MANAFECRLKINYCFTEPSDANAYDTDYIRKELKKVGFFPGPMAGTPTKRLYLKKLRRIKKTVTSPVTHFMKPCKCVSFSYAFRNTKSSQEGVVEVQLLFKVDF